MSEQNLSRLLAKLSTALAKGGGIVLDACEVTMLNRLGCVAILENARLYALADHGDQRGSAPSPRPDSPSINLKDGKPRAFSVKSLADRWSCSGTLVRTLIASGELEAFKFGKLIRISWDAVERFEKVG